MLSHDGEVPLSSIKKGSESVRRGDHAVKGGDPGVPTRCGKGWAAGAGHQGSGAEDLRFLAFPYASHVWISIASLAAPRRITS